MSMTDARALVEPLSTGAALHAAYLAEARVALDAVLSAPAMTSEELAAVLSRSSGGALNEVTLAVLVGVLAG